MDEKAVNTLGFLFLLGFLTLFSTFHGASSEKVARKSHKGSQRPKLSATETGNAFTRNPA